MGESQIPNKQSHKCTIHVTEKKPTVVMHTEYG